MIIPRLTIRPWPIRRPAWWRGVMRPRNAALLPALIVIMVRVLLLACGVTLFIAVAARRQALDSERRQLIGTHVLGPTSLP
jgi:hypothetical protein